MVLAPLIQSATALRSLAHSGYDFNAFIGQAEVHSRHLADYGLPTKALGAMLGQFRQLAGSGYILGAIGAQAWVKKLEAWHLLPTESSDPVRSFQDFKGEVAFYDTYDWEDDSTETYEQDRARFHPMTRLEIAL